ncbi:TPA: transposase [Serratia marcescens]|nr:transposase [Serratia marcescens]
MPNSNPFYPTATSNIIPTLQTYSLQLNQHPHIHVSVTRSGLIIKHNIWHQRVFK